MVAKKPTNADSTKVYWSQPAVIPTRPAMIPNAKTSIATFSLEKRVSIQPAIPPKDAPIRVFNKIYNDGIYPSAGTKGIIVPIHKKGDKLDAQNYRGITFINSMAKIFSLCLRNRLNKWCDMEIVLYESQFGFWD